MRGSVLIDEPLTNSTKFGLSSDRLRPRTSASTRPKAVEQEPFEVAVVRSGPQHGHGRAARLGEVGAVERAAGRRTRPCRSATNAPPALAQSATAPRADERAAGASGSRPRPQRVEQRVRARSRAPPTRRRAAARGTTGAGRSPPSAVEERRQPRRRAVEPEARRAPARRSARPARDASCSRRKPSAARDEPLGCGRAGARSARSPSSVRSRAGRRRRRRRCRSSSRRPRTDASRAADRPRAASRVARRQRVHGEQDARGRLDERPRVAGPAPGRRGARGRPRSGSGSPRWAIAKASARRAAAARRAASAASAAVVGPS